MLFALFTRARKTTFYAEFQSNFKAARMTISQQTNKYDKRVGILERDFVKIDLKEIKRQGRDRIVFLVFERLNSSSGSKLLDFDGEKIRTLIMSSRSRPAASKAPHQQQSTNSK